MQKTFWQVFLETIKGVNNQGSSKRATAFGLFWMTVGCNAVYWFVFVYSALLKQSEVTTLHTMVHSNWVFTLTSDIGAMLTCLGITAWEKKSINKKEVELKKAETNAA